MNAKRRTRSVIFRINQDEYNQLQAACSEIGARSLSDFLRSRVLNAAREPQLARLDQKLDEANLALQRLMQLVGEERPKEPALQFAQEGS